MNHKSSAQKKPKRPRLDSKPMLAEEFAEAFDDLLRGALLYRREREWIESRRGHFATDELSQRCF